MGFPGFFPGVDVGFVVSCVVFSVLKGHFLGVVVVGVLLFAFCLWVFSPANFTQSLGRE